MSLRKVDFKALFISILISLGIGTLSGILVGNSQMAYATLNKPMNAPPGVLFPVVWTILYILMGISAYMIYASDHPGKERALKVYGWQLFVNFSWSIVFFLMQNYLLAFVVLIVLWILIVIMIVYFYEIRKVAAYLQVPYLLWVTYAGYLNLSIYLLNK